MATNRDLRYGRDVSDEILHDICEHTDYDDGDVVSVMAAVLLLDQALDLSQEGDQLVLNPNDIGWILMYSHVVSPPELASLLEQAANEENDDKRRALYTRSEPLLSQWFKIRFDTNDPETGEPFQYAEVLRGKTFTIRSLTEEEAAKARFFCATVRADGTLITLPPPKY